MNVIKQAGKIYMIGIKGAGMTALAELLKKREKKKVSGSDVGEVFFTDEILKKLKIKVYQKFFYKNIQKENPDLVVYSTAYNNKNSELKYARENKIKTLSYPEALGELMKEKYSIAVCGTHGKTTTTAMLALAMRDCGKNPSAIVGSKIKQTGSNALLGESEFLVVEADEYQNKFLHYYPMAVVLTNLDYDHPDFFSSFSDYKKVFVEFVKKIPAYGFLVVWGGDADAMEVALEAKCKIVVFGEFSSSEEIDLAEYFKRINRNNFDVINIPKKLKLKVAGQHNILNATAAYACGRQLKLNEENLINSLNNYQGVARRMDLLGEHNGALIFDDYAHHPEEIKATLKALRQLYPLKNIICVFQSHTYSRTKILLTEFAQSFNDCDELIITHIFSSVREKKYDFEGADLAKVIKKYHPDVQYLEKFDEIFDWLKNKINAKDIVITMGAGDLNEVAQRLSNKKSKS